MIMAYRNGTYIAFHANHKTQPSESDMKYYNLLKAWDANKEHEFEFVNSHDKTQAVRDSSSRQTLERALKTRIINSKNMLLIIGKTTHEDQDWVPFEIRYAVDDCRIPIIAAYTDYECILKPSDLSHLWPYALKYRIENDTARVIHIPFKQITIFDAIQQFDYDNLPNGPLTYYSKETYSRWKIIKGS